MKRVTTEVPDKLFREMEALVHEGWFRDPAEIATLALRRFLASHRPELMEKHILDDVEWGLRGAK